VTSASSRRARRLAAPNVLRAGLDQVGSQKVARDGRKTTAPHALPGNADRSRFVHQKLTGPHALQQPRHAQRGVGPKLKRMNHRVVKPAQHAVHALQQCSVRRYKDLCAQSDRALDSGNSRSEPDRPDRSRSL